MKREAVYVNIACVEERTQEEYKNIINNFCKELKKLPKDVQEELVEALKKFDIEKEY